MPAPDVPPTTGPTLSSPAAIPLAGRAPLHVSACAGRSMPAATSQHGGPIRAQAARLWISTAAAQTAATAAATTVGRLQQC
jgi:hypothetical protein